MLRFTSLLLSTVIARALRHDRVRSIVQVGQLGGSRELKRRSLSALSGTTDYHSSPHERLNAASGAVNWKGQSGWYVDAEEVVMAGLYDFVMSMSQLPTGDPTEPNTPLPSSTPTVPPTPAPTSPPTPTPTKLPTGRPSPGPTYPPTLRPTYRPSSGPTKETVLGSISGRVEEDIDNNDTGDTVINDSTVSLLDGAGDLYASVRTRNGNYVFRNLPAGSFTIVQTNKPNFLDVSPTELLVTLGQGEDLMDQNFVDERVRHISGHVVDEKGLPLKGVLVELKEAGSDNIVEVALTTASGNFRFTVSPGLYDIFQTDLPGWESLGDSDGGEKNEIFADVTSENSVRNVFVDMEIPSGDAVVAPTSAPSTLSDDKTSSPTIGKGGKQFKTSSPTSGKAGKKSKTASPTKGKGGKAKTSKAPSSGKGSKSSKTASPTGGKSSKTKGQTDPSGKAGKAGKVEEEDHNAKGKAGKEGKDSSSASVGKGTKKLGSCSRCDWNEMCRGDACVRKCAVHRECATDEEPERKCLLDGGCASPGLTLPHADRI